MSLHSNHNSYNHSNMTKTKQMTENEMEEKFNIFFATKIDKSLEEFEEKMNTENDILHGDEFFNLFEKSMYSLKCKLRKKFENLCKNNSEMKNLFDEKFKKTLREKTNDMRIKFEKTKKKKSEHVCTQKCCPKINLDVFEKNKMENMENKTKFYSKFCNFNDDDDDDDDKNKKDVSIKNICPYEIVLYNVIKNTYGEAEKKMLFDLAECYKFSEDICCLLEELHGMIKCKILAEKFFTEMFFATVDFYDYFGTNDSENAKFDNFLLKISKKYS